MLTDEEIAAMNQVRDLFEELDMRVVIQLRNPETDAHRAYALGKLSENIGMATNGIFNILSVVGAYELASVSEAQLHNEKETA